VLGLLSVSKVRRHREEDMSTTTHTPPYSGVLQKYPGLVAVAFTLLVGGAFVGALAVQWNHAAQEHRTGEPMEEEMRSHHEPPAP
jgi:hypothetical protein